MKLFCVQIFDTIYIAYIHLIILQHEYLHKRLTNNWKDAKTPTILKKPRGSAPREKINCNGRTSYSSKFLDYRSYGNIFYLYICCTYSLLYILQSRQDLINVLHITKDIHKCYTIMSVNRINSSNTLLDLLY
jgi:hypothetical protein